MATDPDGTNEWLTVSWTSSVDGLLQTTRPEPTGDLQMVNNALSENPHEIVLSVTDDAGSTCNDSISLTVTDTNTAPEVSLSALPAGATFDVGQSIELEATVADAQDDVTDLALSWSSNIDGEFSARSADDTGLATVSVNSLSEGEHEVTLTAPTAVAHNPPPPSRSECRQTRCPHCPD